MWGTNLHLTVGGRAPAPHLGVARPPWYMGFASMRVRSLLPTISSALVFGVAGGCSSTPPPLGDPSEQRAELPTLAAGATIAIDQAKCAGQAARLRPFVVSWDATEQGEFAGHTQDSIAVVKLDGCRLELLPQCRVAGEYRLRQTPGNLQSLSIANEDQLYVDLPLGVASLASHLRKAGNLTLQYYVRGMGYATAPVLYRSQLGPGCEGATHFVLNYAAGAYELGAATQTGAGAGASAVGAAAGADTKSSTKALFRGGEVVACKAGLKGCDVPVRLRLIDILAGAPPAELAPASALAVAKPQAEKAPPGAPPLSQAEILSSIQYGIPSIRACYDRELARDARLGGRVDVRFAVGADGVVSEATTTPAKPFPDAFLACLRDAFFSLRFRALPEPATVNYPLVFQTEDAPQLTGPVAKEFTDGPFAAIAGAWVGDAVDKARRRATTVRIVLRADAPIGSVIGSFDYPDLGCGGDLVRLPWKADERLLREKLLRGKDKCPDGTSIQIKPKTTPDGEAVALEVFWLARDGRPSSTLGILTRP